MEHNKPPGNDGVTKEFYCLFWNEIKNIFIDSLRVSKCLKALSISQRQAIITLTEKLNKEINTTDLFLIGDLFCYLMLTKNVYQKR